MISTKLGYGEHQVPVQGDAEKKTDGLSIDHDDEAQEEGDKSLTGKIYETTSAANSGVSSKLGFMCFLPLGGVMSRIRES